jgi:hypothetical protein
MVLKYKLNTIYNLVIAILISLLLLMLYLGNYNLIEGNTPSQVVNNIASSIENNQHNANVLQNNVPFISACSSVNNNNSNIISEIGGAQSSGAQTVHGANQTLAALCSKNTQNNTQN